MAAGFEIAPNPTVLLAQAVIFAANLVVVKKLFIAPYLRVRDERDSLTVGSKDAADKAVVEAELIGNGIDERIVAASEVARREREVLRQTALEKRQALLEAAEAEGKRTIAEMEKQIQQDLMTERQKIPAIVAELSTQVYQSTVN
jgi:F0F1-type ATP synthase membrane subunit b/b'